MNETIIAEANGLTLKRIRSDAKPLSLPEEFSIHRAKAADLTNIVAEHITPSAFFVAYLDYRVIIGRYDKREFIFYPKENENEIEPKYLQRLRVFNASEELLLWRSGPTLKGRTRRDGEGEDTEIVEAHQVLFGTTATPVKNESFTEISETRGTRLVLPFQNLHVDDKQQRIFLKTRNYIDSNAIHQATYVDCRFVGFAEKEGDSYRDLM